MLWELQAPADTSLGCFSSSISGVSKLFLTGYHQINIIVFVYPLTPVHVPPVVLVPQVGNPCSSCLQQEQKWTNIHTLLLLCDRQTSRRQKFEMERRLCISHFCLVSSTRYKMNWTLLFYFNLTWEMGVWTRIHS